ncbi:uncharacterized protein LY89DRAFT_4130 [Mollisia scopiformis]|uniref:DUF7708 domain-containing protein n=1 Tax=Mollisia scopiformis TaxID=149040 RepID=A0A194XUD9_MOLSC|nr:uncharacterized protein LY89DRAFT_4130 [Mollisia scopiformis]KUJ23828.1 hypothetical protein LY89DRAFT_4130 [Mollisia scopiformis]
MKVQDMSRWEHSSLVIFHKLNNVRSSTTRRSGQTMQEAREAVARYATTLANLSTQIEAALTRAEPLIVTRTTNELNEEALKILEIERDALACAWALLKQDLSAKGIDNNIMGPAPTTFESVISTAEDAQTTMNNRKRPGGGKARDYYNKFCHKAYQHRSVFDIFPNTNEYVSVFCGSIKTLVKASVNYIQISEGLSSALNEITELVDFAKRQVGVNTTQYTTLALAKLYKEIFLYLKEYTEWFTKTSKARDLRSFIEDFYAIFSDRMECIRSIANTVYQEVMLGSMQMIQTKLAPTDDLEQQRRRDSEYMKTLLRVERQQMTQAATQQKILQKFETLLLQILDRESGLRARGMLEDIVHTDQWQRRARVGRIESPYYSSVAPSGNDTETALSLPSQDYTAGISTAASESSLHRDEIVDSSKCLERFILGNSVDFLNILPPARFASAPVATKLREWFAGRKSPFLWVRGPSAGRHSLELSSLSGSLIRAALESKAPIIFHFCEPIRQVDLEPGFGVEEAGAISLAYSLIRQLILLLEPEVDVRIDLSAARFRLLESPLINWKFAISILEDLLSLSPGVLLCVIDGFDELDYDLGQSLCRDLLTLFRRREQESTQKGLVFKMLFTTRNFAESLHAGLTIDEVVIDTEWKHPNHSSQGPGRKFIFDGDEGSSGGYA